MAFVFAFSHSNGYASERGLLMTVGDLDPSLLNYPLPNCGVLAGLQTFQEWKVFELGYFRRVIFSLSS